MGRSSRSQLTEKSTCDLDTAATEPNKDALIPGGDNRERCICVLYTSSPAGRVLWIIQMGLLRTVLRKKEGILNFRKICERIHKHAWLVPIPRREIRGVGGEND